MLVIMTITLIVMRVAQDSEFLEEEKSEQAGQQRRKKRMNIGFGLEGLGQSVQQRSRQHDAYRQADHALHHLGEEAVRQKSGSGNADHTREYGGQQNVG